MAEPSVGAPHKVPIGRTSTDDQDRADYIRIVCGLDPKSRATLELRRAYRELNLAQNGWTSAIENLLRAHVACWEHEVSGRPVPTAALLRRDGAEADFRTALRDLRYVQGRCWELERLVCQ